MRTKWMAILVVGLPLAGCQTYGNDQMSQYLQRKDGVTLSAGDSSRVNANAMALQQWPEGVGDRRIPMEGTRAANAMQTYRCDNAQRGPIQTQKQSQTQPTANGGSATTEVSQTGRAKTPDGC